MARRPVDEKIVKLSMDNADLTQKAAESTSILSKLRDGLNKIPGVNLGKTTKELSDIGSATKGINMDALGQSISAVGDRFSAMGIIGATVLQNLTNRAVDMGVKLAKSLTIDQIGEGFREYELKMGSIRTIMANTEHEGATLVDVKKSLEDLNKYADLTIYNFGQMTDSIGRFTAAGVGLEDSTIAIKGMSNLAATSGATTHQLNSAMYQMSQAMAAGRFNLMDWNSLVNSGMGGKITQDGLRKTAEEMGVMIDMSEGFRESLKDGWLTSEIFLKTMKTFAEDDTMLEAATKIRTFTQLIDTVQEAIGSGLGMTFEHIFGDFEEASELFSTLGEAMTGWVDSTMDKFNEFVGAIADGGGFLNIFKGLGNILKPFGQILGAVAEGFGRAFKSVTPEVIVNATEKFLKFTESLKLSEGVVKVLTSIFEYFFTGIRLGFSAIKNITNIIGKGINTVIDFGKAIGNIVPSSRGVVDAISGVGIGIGRWLGESKIQPLVNLGTTIEDMFFMFKERFNETGSLLGSFKGLVSDVLSIVISDFKKLEGPLEWFGDILISIGGLAKDFGKAVADVLGGAWELVKDIFSGVDFRHFLGGGFLVGVWGIVKKLIENMDGLTGVWKGIKDFIEVMKSNSDSKGFLTNLTESLTNFSDSLKNAISVGNIVAIATAIGILAVSMKILEDLDTAQITRGMAAIAGAMVTLSWGMKAMDGVDIGGVGSLKLIAFAAAIKIMVGTMSEVAQLNANQMLKGAVGLATAAGILATTVAVMDGKKVGTGPVTMLAIAGTIKILVSTLDDIDAVRVEGLIKGIGTIGLLLVAIATFSNVMDGVKVKPGTAIAIAGIAGVIHILVNAIDKIDDIRVEGLMKGLGTIGILLAEIAVFANVTRDVKIGPAQAIGLLGIAGAMVIMAGAIKKIDDIRVEGLIKGLGTMAVILATVATFANSTTRVNFISTAAGLVIIAGAMNLLVRPLQELGGMRWQDLVKGLGTMAGALAAMAIAGNIASGTISGAVAITIMAASLNLLIDPIERLSDMTWGELIGGLTKLALTLGLITAASLLLAPAAGPMLTFSAGLIGFGAAVALIGGGLALFGVGLTSLAGLTATAVATIITAVEMLMDAFIGMLGKIRELIVVVIETVAGVITDSAETIVTAVITLIMAILKGVDDNLEPFIDRGASIIMKLMKGIEKHAEPLVKKGMDTIIALVEGMASAIDENGPELTTAIVKLFGAILVVIVDAGTEMLKILFGWIPGADRAITSLGNDMTAAIRKSFGLDEEVKANFKRAGGNIDNAYDGMRRKSGRVATGTTDEFAKNYLIDKVGKEKGTQLIASIASGEVGVQKAGASLGRKGRDGASSVDWSPAGRGLADGLSIGIGSRSGSIWTAAWNLGKSALNAVKNAIKSQSPSKETTKEGENFGQGLVNGIVKMTKTVGEKAGAMGQEALDSTNAFLDSMTTDMDREVRVKVVMDTADFDEWNPEGFNPVVPNTRFTNRMVSESQPVDSQNGNNLNRNDGKNSERFRGDNITYDIDIHTTDSELNDDTARKWAKKLSVEIEKNNNENRRGNGVIVNHVY